MVQTSEKKLLEAAKAGYLGRTAHFRRGSHYWRAHALGGHLAETARCRPFDVYRDAGMADSLWVNNMRFRIVVGKDAVTFERTA